MPYDSHSPPRLLSRQRHKMTTDECDAASRSVRAGRCAQLLVFPAATSWGTKFDDGDDDDDKGRESTEGTRTTTRGWGGLYQHRSSQETHQRLAPAKQASVWETRRGRAWCRVKLRRVIVDFHGKHNFAGPEKKPARMRRPTLLLLWERNDIAVYVRGGGR